MLGCSTIFQGPPGTVLWTPEDSWAPVSEPMTYSMLCVAVKESMVSVCDGLTPKIEAVITKLNSQSQTLKEIEDREIKVRQPEWLYGVLEVNWQCCVL